MRYDESSIVLSLCMLHMLDRAIVADKTLFCFVHDDVDEYDGESAVGDASDDQDEYVVDDGLARPDVG